MKKEFVNNASCPRCKNDLKLSKINKKDKDEIINGEIKCTKCKKTYKIIKSIPRFVKMDNYSNSFGLQWNAHSKILLDSDNNTKQVYEAIMERTQWSKNYLKNKKVLECGCGAGIDSEVLLKMGANLTSFDLSNAVDAALENNKNSKKYDIFQGDITKIPLKKRSFDIVYCHRVIQHTPNPKKSFSSMAKMVKKGGELFMHSYDRAFINITHWRYLYRPITKRINEEKLYQYLEKHGPKMYRFCKKIDKYYIGKAFHHFFIPFYNHSQKKKNISTFNRKTDI